MSEEKVCTACMFCRHADYGYSNYTVEGTMHECIFGLNPPADDGITTDDKKLAAWNSVAEKCRHYKEGIGVYSDCDGEDEDQSISEWIRLYIKDAP